MKLFNQDNEKKYFSRGIGWKVGIETFAVITPQPINHHMIASDISKYKGAFVL
jgi:hypothetical protein